MFKRQQNDLAKLIPSQDPAAAQEFCHSLRQFLTARNDQRLNKKETPVAGEHGAEELPDTSRPEISIIVPVYNEESNLEDLYRQLIEVLNKEKSDFELIFVNDGSTDRSLLILDSISRSDDRVAVIELARNFGQQIALTAGMDYSRGKAVVLLDADLEDPPEVIPELIRKWRAGYEVVYAISANLNSCHPHASRLGAYAERLVKSITSFFRPLQSSDFCIMDRKVVDLLGSMRERNRFVRGIRSWVGFNQLGIEINQQLKSSARKKYKVVDLTEVAIGHLVALGSLPLRLLSLAGIVLCLLALLLLLFFCFQAVLFGGLDLGIATVVVLLMFLSGVNLLAMGVMAEYVGRIFDEVKQRPLYVIQRLTGQRFS